MELIPTFVIEPQWMRRYSTGFLYKVAWFYTLIGLTLQPVNKKYMSGALKEVRNRIKSVQSTQQITKAMKMVSAAKLRRAQDAIIQMRPYAKKLQEMLGNIVSNAEGDVNMALAKERPVEKVLMIVITSDRGYVVGTTVTLLSWPRSIFTKNMLLNLPKEM